MAVWTQVSLDETNKWLKERNLGAATAIKPVEEGVEDSVFKLTLTDGASACLRLFERTEPTGPLAIASLLAKSGLPTCPPIVDAQGQSLVQLNGKPAVLFPWIDGAWEARPSLEQIHSIGAFLGHVAKESKEIGQEWQRENPRGIKWFEETARMLMPVLPPVQRQEIQTELNEQKRFWASVDKNSVQHGPVHGDLFRDNVLFGRDGKLAAVLDWGFCASNQPLVYDMAIVANDWCLQNGSSKLDPNRFDALVRGRESVMPLTEGEKNALPMALRLAGMRFYLSRSIDYHFPRDPSGKKLDPEHFHNILNARRMNTSSITGENNTLNIGFVGGAASTILTMAYLVRDLKEFPISDKNIILHVFDPKGLNTGLAYNVKNEGFRLNQPAGDDMDAFLDGGSGLPKPFLKWLDQTHVGYNTRSFAPRGLYGDYLLYVKEWLYEQTAKMPHVLIDIVRTKVSDVQPSNQNGRYRVIGDNKSETMVDGIVLATGHTTSPRATHNQYLPSYVDDKFEHRLGEFAKDGGDKIIIGSGASMADMICALENMGSRSSYVVVSPQGRTGWSYDPYSPEPTAEQKEYISKLVSTISKREVISPVQAINTTMKLAAKQEIAPQYVLKALLDDPYVQASSELLVAAKTVYGNPLSPDRHAMLETLEAEGRLTYQIGRIKKLSVVEGDLYADFGNNAKQVFDRIIDCAVVDRGEKNQQGEISTPLLAKLFDNNIIDALPPETKAVDLCPAAGKPIWAVGPLTNEYRNGLGTFRQGYRVVADMVANHVDGLLSVPKQAVRPANSNYAKSKQATPET